MPKGVFPRTHLVPPETRLLSRVDTTDPDACWIHSGSTASGYPIIFFQGKQISAHRLSWVLFNGEIPEGMHVLHACPNGKDNKRCINPKHLYLGTPTQNSLDSLTRGQRRLVPDGSGSSKPRLTEDDVREIRRAMSSPEKRYGSSTSITLSRKFGVSQSTIERIAKNTTWGYVDG